MKKYMRNNYLEKKENFSKGKKQFYGKGVQYNKKRK